ncbi:MAG: NUDIX hydrolase [Moorellaceae bacterium]
MSTWGLPMENLRSKVAQHKSDIMDVNLYNRSAVLVPLVREREGNYAVVFEVRSAKLATQPGEICFPGGHLNPTEAHAEEAAIRETCEELGVPPSSVEIWGRLDILVTPFKQIIYPFAGYLKEPERIRPNPQEVEEVFMVKLDFLLSLEPEYHEIAIKVHPPDDFPFHKIPHGRAYPWRTGTWPEFFYEIENHVVWGMTARILHHFLEIIR